MVDHIWWKTTFEGSKPSMEDGIGNTDTNTDTDTDTNNNTVTDTDTDTDTKTTYDGRRLMMENDL